MAKLLLEEVEVYSEKYDIHGTVRDYGMVTKLFFTYDGKGFICLLPDDAGDRELADF
ncbi:MAG: hypothetical protein IJT37_07165 [Lachnospiraceae bacterium]|nr:hypothetical protein [Lachnospiraceae bacterium]